VERVAADHNLSTDLVERLDEQDKSWFEHFTAGFTGSATGTDIAIKTAKTIRALAWVGRAIIVGRGGQSILANMSHVLHVRLYAPLEWRIEQYARMEGVTEREAEERVDELDEGRSRYVRQHFNRDVAEDGLYDLTINVARLGADRAAEVIASAVPKISGASSPR
jgi:cytidylate kinase